MESTQPQQQLEDAVSGKEHIAGMEQNSSWVELREHGERKQISVLLNFLSAIVLRSITHFMPWKMFMSDRFSVNRNCHNCDSCLSAVISDLFVPWSFILSRGRDV